MKYSAIFVDKKRPLSDYNIFVVDDCWKMACLTDGIFHYGQEGTRNVIGELNHGEGSGFDINSEHRIMGGSEPSFSKAKQYYDEMPVVDKIQQLIRFYKIEIPKGYKPINAIFNYKPFNIIVWNDQTNDIKIINGDEVIGEPKTIETKFRELAQEALFNSDNEKADILLSQTEYNELKPILDKCYQEFGKNTYHLYNGKVTIKIKEKD